MNPSVIGADVDACFAHFTRRIGELALLNSANAGRVVALGGPELLTRILEKAGDDALLQGAATALSNLSLHEEGRKQVLNANAVDALVGLLASRFGDEVHAAACAALRNLACVNEGRARIRDLGGVETMVRLCEESGSESVQENAAAAIANLADDQESRDKVASCGGLEALCELCNSSSSDAVLACTAAALGNLADDDNNRVMIAKIGGLEPLVRLCASSVDDSVLESSAAALANLAYNEANRKRIAQLTGIEPLVWLCAHSTNDAVLESAAAALGNLAYYNDMNRIKIAETGGLNALVHLCETSGSESVLESATGALRHVVYNNESNRIRFVKLGGLELLVKLATHSESEAVLEGTTAMLRKAVASPETAHTLIEAGALPALLKLESEWIGTVQSYATSTLKNLEKHARKPWSPPSGSQAPTAAYMLLPCAHLASMTDAVRRDAIPRATVGGELKQDVAHSLGTPEEQNREMDGVHRDLALMEGFVRGRTKLSVQDDLSIEAADSSILTQDPMNAIQTFFKSDEVDVFVLFYSGHATKEGWWCFSDGTVSFQQVLGMWQQARAKASNTDARLIIVSDSPNSGAWVDALNAVPPAAAFASGIAVQASCAAGGQSWSEGAQGGCFTSWFINQASHGHSPWSIGEAEQGGGPPNEGQVPCMCCKWDVLSQRRVIMCVGGEEHTPDISLYGSGWFSSREGASPKN